MFNVGDKFKCIEGHPKNEKAANVALPKAKPKKMAGVFNVGDLIVLNSNEERGSFYPAKELDELIGTIQTVSEIQKYYREYTRIFFEGSMECFVDSRQCSHALRKNGKPRILRKLRATKLANVAKELNKRCAFDAESVSNYALVYGDNKINWNIKAACFASLNYEEFINQEAIALFVNTSTHYRNHDNKEGYKQWTKYITQRSPFKEGFKKLPRFPWNGSVEMGLDKSRSFVVTSAIALREGHEYSFTMEAWLFLVKKGVDENVAWVVSRFLNKTGDKIVLYPGNAHTVAHFGMGRSSLLKLIKHGLKEPKNAKPFKEKKSGRYEVFTTIDLKFRYQEENGLYSEMRKQIKTTKIGEGWNVKQRVDVPSLLEFCAALEKEYKEMQ